MRRRSRTTLVEDVIMAPWWISLVLWVIGNLIILFAIPAYLEANISTGILGGMLTNGYAGAQPVLVKFFNLVMAIVFGFSLLNNFVFKRRWQFRHE
jgi:hypothetical protein